MKNTTLKKVTSGIGKFFAVLLTTVALVLIFLLGVCFILIHGPSNAAKNQFVCALQETSAMGWVANIYLSKEEISEIVESNLMMEVADGTVSDTELVNIDPNDKVSEDIPEIQVLDITGDTYKGKMIIVKDPSRVFVGTIPEFFEGTGQVVKEICDRYDAVAGINGGEFVDMGSYSYSAMPVGAVISQGELLMGSLNTTYNITGFTEDNILVVGKMTAQEAIDMGIRDCVHTEHTTGPFLLIDGEPLTVPDTTTYGGGKNPRTAIGQTADGSVLLLVVDGRQAESIGATFKDMTYIMMEYGAVNASCMDGGTSTQMVYEGEVINKPYSPTGPRRCPTSFIVQ
ncbi:MAG: phosphodiester glycosidase family protein [Clostridiales bacterium]|nr:phosphodiester glycosidase family protein [Clostridiales bacterium]